MSRRGAFVPALSCHWLTPLYDLVAERLFGQRARIERLVHLGSPRGGERVLDLGGGTGTLAERLLAAEPECRPVVVDIDLRMLAVARCKLAGRRASLLAASCDRLPLAAASVDRAFSSLTFHHLVLATKRSALAELRRVLRPSSSFFLLDFGRPKSLYALGWLLSAPWRLFDGWENTRDNFNGRLPELIRAAGFASVEELARERTPIGAIVAHRASVPGGAAP